MSFTAAELSELFETSVTATRKVSEVKEADAPAEALAIELANSMLAEHEDTAVEVHESAGGFIVAGSQNAVIIANDGPMRLARPKKGVAEDADVTFIGAWKGKATSNDTFLKAVEGATPSVGTEGELNFMKYVKDGETMGVMLPQGDKARYLIPVPAMESVDDTKLAKGGKKKFTESLQEALTLIESDPEKAFGALNEAYMAIASDDKYDPDSPFSVYSSSINIRIDNFISKTPDYSVANFVMRLALQDALRGPTGKKLEDAIRAALAASPKVKALDIELRGAANESIDEAVGLDREAADTGTFPDQNQTTYDETALRARITEIHAKLSPSLATALGEDDDATTYLGGWRSSNAREYRDIRAQLGQRLVRSDDGTIGKWVAGPGNYTGGGPATNESESGSPGVLVEKGDFISSGGKVLVVTSDDPDNATAAPVEIKKDENRFKVVGAEIKGIPSTSNFLGKSVAEAAGYIEAFGVHEDSSGMHIASTTDGEKLKRMHAFATKMHDKAPATSKPHYFNIIRKVRKQAAKHGVKLGEGWTTGNVSPYAGKDDDGDSDKISSDPDSTVAVIVPTDDGKKLELRAGYDGDGEVLASESADVTDDDELKSAQGRLAQKAISLGYVYVPHNMKEGYEQVENHLAGLLIGSGKMTEASKWLDAFETAATADEPASVLAAAEAVAEAIGKTLLPGIVEGLTARAHKRGKRPGLRIHAKFAFKTPEKPKGKTGPGSDHVHVQPPKGKTGIHVVKEDAAEGSVDESAASRAQQSGQEANAATKKAERSNTPDNHREAARLHSMTAKHAYRAAEEGKGLLDKAGVEAWKKTARSHEERAASHKKKAEFNPMREEEAENNDGKTTTVPDRLPSGEIKQTGPGAKGGFSNPPKGKKGLCVGVEEGDNAQITSYGEQPEAAEGTQTNQKPTNFNTGSIGKPKTAGPQNLIKPGNAPAASEGVSDEGTSKDQMSKQCACPNCENTADITVGKNKVTCGNCGYTGAAADFQLPSTVGQMAEAWIASVRGMGLEEFVADLTKKASTDSDDEFRARTEAMIEAYRCGPGKKDMARKITAGNPIVKKKLGKGISLEGVETAGATSEGATLPKSMRITFPKGRQDEFLLRTREAGSDGSGEVDIVDENIVVTMPYAAAMKTKLLFTGSDVKYEPVAGA